MTIQHVPTFAVETHGCKLNQADSQILIREFTEAGYLNVSSGSVADVYVLNTCTVTHIADRKARQSMRAMRRRNPEALVVVTGCYAERSPSEVSRIEGVDVVYGNNDKQRLVQQVSELRGHLPVPCAVGEELQWLTTNSRTRAMVKIQEGCDQICAYCIVPKVRGRERSIPTVSMLNEITRLTNEGYQEVVLTGTQLGTYGFDLPDGSLDTLISRILNETSIARLRVSSLQAQEIGENLLTNWADPRLCPHFHLPLQSGSQSVLKRMRRRYSPEQYYRVVEWIRNSVPGASITADVIVGFPGETEAEFRETIEFCASLDFAALHVFPYSARPGTSAAHFGNHVDAQTKRYRTETLLGLAEEQSRIFNQNQIGKVHRVLWEDQYRLNGVQAWRGLTENYIRVYCNTEKDLSNTIRSVCIEKYDRGVLWAGLIE